MRSRFLSLVAFAVCWIALPLEAASLWMANDVEVRRVELANVSADVRVPIANVVGLAATRDGGAFAVAKERLIRIDADGILNASVDVGAMGYGPPSLLAAEVGENAVWVATHGNMLIRIDADGNVDAGAALPGRPQALAIAADRTVWALGAGSLWHYSAAVALLQSVPVPSL